MVNQTKEEMDQQLALYVEDSIAKQASVRKSLEAQVQALHEKLDARPLVIEKIESLKEEIKTDLQASMSKLSKSPRVRSKGAGAFSSGKLGGSPTIGGMSDKDFEDAEDNEVDEAGLQAVMEQINTINESLPKRFDKFQQQINERQKVTDAKTKKMVKDSTEKLSKQIQKTNETQGKLQKGISSI